MSCNHLHDCPRCGGIVEDLSHALEQAIGEIKKYDTDNSELKGLEYVLDMNGMFLDEY